MKLTRPSTLAAVLAVALLGALAAGVVAHASATTKTIKVTEREYRIGLSTRRAAAGSVLFVIKNTGRLTHQFAIAGPGLRRPKKSTMIRPGSTVRLKVTLKPGKYSIWCPVPGHAALGMKSSLRVPGTTGSSGGTYGGGTTTTPPATTTTGEAWG